MCFILLLLFVSLYCCYISNFLVCNFLNTTETNENEKTQTKNERNTAATTTTTTLEIGKNKMNSFLSRLETKILKEKKNRRAKRRTKKTQILLFNGKKNGVPSQQRFLLLFQARESTKIKKKTSKKHPLYFLVGLI